MTDIKIFINIKDLIEKILIKSQKDEILKPFNVDEDKKYLYVVFIDTTDEELILKIKDKLNLSTTKYLNYTEDDWINLMKIIKLNNFSFIDDKSKITLKTIFNLADDNDKKKLIEYFSALCKFIKSKNNLYNFMKSHKKDVQKDIINQKKFENIISNMSNYKDPDFVANIIDSLNDKDFKEYITNTIKAKTNINLDDIMKVDESFINDILENITQNTIMDSLEYLFNIIMKIKLSPQIKCKREISDFVFNYINELFRKSEVIQSICEKKNNEYEKSNNKKFKKTSTIKFCNSLNEMVSDNYDSGFNKLNWDYILNNDEVIDYKKYHLQSHFHRLVMKVIEILINYKHNGTFNNLNTEFSNKFNEFSNQFEKFKNIYSKLKTFNQIDNFPLLVNVIDDIIENKEEVLDIIKSYKNEFNIKNILQILDLNLNDEYINNINSFIYDFIEELILSITSFDEEEKSLEKIKDIASYIDSFIIKIKNINKEKIKKNKYQNVLIKK